MLLYAGSLITSFIGVFIRVTQTKNIVGNHIRAAFVTSYFYALADVATIAFVVKGGWLIALTSGTGAAFGVVTAMSLHGKVLQRGTERP